MEGLNGLLGEARRLVTPGAPEAPYVWALIALGTLALALAVMLMRRRRVRSSDVERIFMASTAANRRQREISEIDQYARKVAASAEDMKARVRKLRLGHFTQVKIYIDHSNFVRSWAQSMQGRDRQQEHDIDWSRLPGALLDEVADWLTQQRRAPQALVYRGTNVYGTLFQDDYFQLLHGMLETEATTPDKLPLPMRLRKETIERWRAENEAQKTELTRTLEGEPGYLVVPIFRRTPRREHLHSANFTSGGIPIAPEKKLDTHIATDLIGDGTFDVYDIAILATEDSDFVPAVEFVQEMRGKMVIHVGFGSRMNDLRQHCRHRIDLTRSGLAQRIRRPAPGSAPATVVEHLAPGNAPAKPNGNGGGRRPAPETEPAPAAPRKAGEA
jgi:uncharacterized LabA/DUF88 family protein